MINIYNSKEIKILGQGGKLLAKILKQVAEKVKIGVSTEYLNKVAEDLIFSYGAIPSFKGFNGFPAALCTSINEEIVHGVPSKGKIKQGDVLSLDLGIRFRGYCTDMAITVGVGKVSEKTQKLIDVTKKSLEIGIQQIKPGNKLGDIGWAIQDYVEKNNFNVVRELVGHGVGKKVHEDPQILNYGDKGEGVEIQEGMVLALEPMVVAGDWHVVKGGDGFSYKTIDNRLSAHFEKTIAVTKNGFKILTK